MILWLCIVAALIVALGLVAFFVPVQLSSNWQARAEPSGTWALALGFAVGPLAVTALAATGVAPFLTVHVFGKQVARVPVARWLRALGAREPKPEPSVDPEPETERPSKLARAARRFLQRLDPVDVLLEWWEKERTFEVRSLVIDLDYSFHDVALTGRILAALYVLSGVLPERCVINQTPGWDAEDRVAFAADGKFAIWPGRLLVYVVQFVLKHRARVEPSALTVS